MKLPYPVVRPPVATDFEIGVQGNFDEIALQVGDVGSVTSLPTTPVNAQEIFYVADATNGIVWHLKYRSASASTYKWEFIGGAAMFSEVTTASTRANVAYGDLAAGAVGPTVTVPLAGDYEVSFGLGMFQTTGGVGWASYNIGATTAVDADGVSYGSTTTGVNPSRTRVKTIAAASTALTMKYKATANTINAFDRWMRVVPVRVG